MFYIWNGKFLKAYSVIYFMLMIWACVIAESHIVGGGGNSDVSLWSSESRWSSQSTGNTINMIFFTALWVCPWFASGCLLPKGTFFKILLTLHFIIGLLIFILYVGGIFSFHFFGSPQDYEMQVKELAHAPIDKYTSGFLAYFFGPIILLYDIIMMVFGLIGADKSRDNSKQ